MGADGSWITELPYTVAWTDERVASSRQITTATNVSVLMADFQVNLH